MKILIATGIYPPEIGGPAMYAYNIFKEFKSRGHNVEVITFGVGKRLPTILRHIYIFFKIIFKINSVDLIIVLDTFSVGWPAILSGLIFNKKTVLRVGGDFLWESYVNSNIQPKSIIDFYRDLPLLNYKHRVIKMLQTFVFNNASALAFTTEWQAHICKDFYHLEDKRIFVIDNYFPKKIEDKPWQARNIIFAGRNIPLKNVSIIREIFKKEDFNGLVFQEYDSLSNGEVMEKIKSCYAVILPSFSEVSPNFIIEAISLNKPFILTKECGLQTRFNNLGLFIDPFDRDDIINKLRMIGDDKVYGKLKENIRNFNYTHSWKQIADEFLDIYKNI